VKLIRIGLCTLLAFAVLAFGSVEVWSQSVVEIGAALLLLGWIGLVLFRREPEIVWSPLNWAILGVCAVGILQLLFHFSAYPFLTRAELLRAVAAWIIFFLATQAFRSRAELQGLAWFVMLFCFLVSLLAIAQYFTAGDQIFWFRDAGSGLKPFGPYVNRNHFGGFVELTLPTGLGLLMFRGLRRDLVPIGTVLVLVPISAVVLSSSRGGIIGVAAEICMLAVFRLSRRKSDKLRMGPVAVAIVAAVLLIGWIGASNALARFTPGRTTGVSLGKRVAMSRGAINIFRAHPVFGSGLGTIVAVYPRFETMYDSKLVDHVHDDYAETLAETGILGGLCGAAFLLILFRGAFQNLTAEQGHFSRALHAGSTAAVVGMLLHSFVDFNLHIAANALLFLVQASVVMTPPVASAGSTRSKLHYRDEG
jgi:O-antigen ligase